MIFWGEIVSYLVYLDQGKDFKLTTELSEKVQYPNNQAIKNELNEAIAGFQCHAIQNRSK